MTTLTNITIVHTCDCGLLKLPLSFFFHKQSKESLATQLGPRPVILPGHLAKAKAKHSREKFPQSREGFLSTVRHLGKFFLIVSFSASKFILYNVSTGVVLFESQRKYFILPSFKVLKLGGKNGYILCTLKRTHVSVIM